MDSQKLIKKAEEFNKLRSILIQKLEKDFYGENFEFRQTFNGNFVKFPSFDLVATIAKEHGEFNYDYEEIYCLMGIYNKEFETEKTLIHMFYHPKNNVGWLNPEEPCDEYFYFNSQKEKYEIIEMLTRLYGNFICSNIKGE